MIGQTISHYHILEKLGEGGMGVVYKAQDTTLDRSVALKFLPPHLSGSEQDKARFLLEAKAAATLNHPNICTIYGIEEAEGKTFIVMEFVDGQTLQQKKSSLSRKQALEIGIQIADGLAAAHEKGIVHRDIKPENIMIRKDGIAQVMDFGLAKLRGASRLTKEGSTVGTAGYMSPEQVQGQDADHRSDIFALGVLLYEMLTGQIPFKGVHETAIAYEIVNVDSPPMSSVKSDISPELDSIVLECLEKDPNERAQSAKQVGIDLKRFKRESSRERLSRITSARPILRTSRIEKIEASDTQELTTVPIYLQLPWILAIVFFAGMLLFGGLYYMRSSGGTNVVRSLILPPENSRFANYLGGGVAVSPDGLKLAFIAVDSSGHNRLCIRPLNSLTAQQLPGTEGASFPFWSTDSRFIGFFASAKLKKVEAMGGPPSTLCDAPDARGGTWSKDGVILFAPNWIGGLYRVSGAGGTPTVVTSLDTTRREQTHRWPSFLPDGKHFLYFSRSSAGGSETDQDAIVLSALDGSTNTRLLAASSNAAYAAGHILFARQSVLMAVPFNASSLTLAGDAFPIAEQISYAISFNRANFSVSENGVLAYKTGGSDAGSQLLWFDRAGKRVGAIGNPGSYSAVVLSHDEKKLAVSVFDPQSHNRDIWIIDIARGIRTRFTFDPSVEDSPVWSPDDSRIMYCSDKKGHLDIYRKSVNGEGGEELVLASNFDKYPTDWSPDGRFLLYYTAGHPITKTDMWVLPLVGDRRPISILQTEFEEVDGQFSPDGKWIAYASTESGRNEVYVRPYPGTGAKWQVSTTGLNPALNILASRWRRDGKELYFLSGDQKLMAELRPVGSSMEVGKLKPLFETQSKEMIALSALSRDAQRFLTTSTIDQSSTPITLVLNWDEELKRK